MHLLLQAAGCNFGVTKGELIQMIIHISFKNVDHSDALKVYTEEKCAKIAKYFEGKITLNWNFSIENKNKIAHVHMLGNHIDLFGEASTEDFHASVDGAIARIEKQIRKHKEIVTNHHVAAEEA